ncbi:MAG: type II secretion system F family protein [Patescibacteria group bacterium]
MAKKVTTVGAYLKRVIDLRSSTRSAPTHTTHTHAHTSHPRAAALAVSSMPAINWSYSIGTPKLSIKEQTFFVKRLAFLIKANVPILEGLHMVSEQSSSRSYKKVLGSVISDVTNGTSLAKSLGRFPATFGEFGINIIKVGESSGTLSQNLEYLADELRKSHVLRKKLMGAFVYPAVIVVATLGITAFLMLYLFPKIMPVFASMHMELPLTTRIVIWVSTFLQNWGLTFSVVVVLSAIALTMVITRVRSIRFWFHRFLTRMPMFGSVVRAYNLAGISRTLGLLLKSGITLSEALPLTADTTKNLVYQHELRVMAHAVNRGERVSTYLAKRRKIFPDVMSQMVAVGEKTGNLSNTLVYLSELYDAEVDDFTKNLSALIEPALMVVMGLLVGFIAVSIITPIYGITQNINP